MTFFAIAVLAGLLTVLAPCILPLLPIVIGTTGEGHGIPKRSLVVIGSLAVSVFVFTLLLKASTVLIDIPQLFWTTFSGAVIIIAGIAIVFPDVWTRVPFLSRLSIAGNTAIGAGYMRKDVVGDVLIGVALGPVFSTCSPTYLFIIATVLPASYGVGLVYLFGFVLGLSIALLAIAYFGDRLTSALSTHAGITERIKRVLGVLIILVGVAILTGYDKKIETAILDAGYGATIQFEQTLIESSGLLQTNESMKKDISAIAPENLQYITLAGGCFWCIEAQLQTLPGVVDAISGYAGGSEEDAKYLFVSKGTTGHREAVQITYDSSKTSTAELLNKFWASTDPTDAGGQFADRGPQYTTAIYYHTDEQRKIAEESKASLAESGLLEGPIVTEILPYTSFFPAEEYHQDYFIKAADHYERYKKGSGRAGFIEDTWARDAAQAYFEEQEQQANNVSSTTPPEVRGSYEYTDEEIQEKLNNLDPLSYHVVAEGGTESPFNNAYWDNKAEGIYVDVVTGKPLFSSTHKYDSGTGWPSFYRTIEDDALTMHKDTSLFMTRTEIRSDGGHVGHVFDDGPIEQGGQRFCTNSASLRFVPKEDMEKEGYGAYRYLFEQ